ncbi:hypothetical protein HYT02_05315 [Candidatus Gottesmanbacteria bacterium]|nr:hypothetical protein [Candidatus Gottesmanbacteria bacterium]
MDRFIIIDGNAILHRAYHALPPLTNKDGKITNAVYGFSAIVLKVISDFKPQYLAVTFDRPAPTFRKKLYKEYQAKRPEMEDNLSSQIEMIHDLVKALGIPIYELDGYEADDLIGTISRTIDGKVEKIIVTGDRDIFQLVNKDTKVLMPTKGLSEGKLFGVTEVKEKMGVSPNEITYLKALTGDSSDNYPGVSGIGPKTATFLIENYKTIDGIYNAIKTQKFSVKIPDKVVERLAEGHQDCMMSLKLATIVTDAPIKFDLNKAKLPQNGEKFARVFQEFGFESLSRRASGKVIQPAPKPKIETKPKENQLGLF